MKQMMRIEFYPTVWDDKTHWLEKEETIIDPECIVRIDGIETKPVEVKEGYQTYRKVKDERWLLSIPRLLLEGASMELTTRRSGCLPKPTRS